MPYTLLVLVLAACGGRDAFVCGAQAQCVSGGAAGRCEAVGYCSFADTSCADGFRFGEYSPAEIAGTCVGQGGTRVVTLEAAADAWIESAMPGFAHGKSSTLRADGDPPAHMLLRFDLGAIPAAADVAMAELKVTTTSGGALPQGSTDVYLLREAWAEGDKDNLAGTPSWTQRDDQSAWAAPGAGGASRDDAPIASLVPAASDAEYVVLLPASAVAGWVKAPASNDGVILVNRDAGNRSVLLHARETGDPGKRPRLVVAYRQP
jgi:hypothetical protein